MQRVSLLAGIAVTSIWAVCGANSAAPACPPANTLGTNTGWELAAASYSAQQAGDTVTVTATGQNRTGGFKVQFAREPVKIFPPKFAFYRKPPEGMATQAITPFTICVTFKAAQNVGVVVVRDSNGDHRVPVESVR